MLLIALNLLVTAFLVNFGPKLNEIVVFIQKYTKNSF